MHSDAHAHVHAGATMTVTLAKKLEVGEFAFTRLHVFLGSGSWCAGSSCEGTGRSKNAELLHPADASNRVAEAHGGMAPLVALTFAHHDIAAAGRG